MPTWRDRSRLPHRDVVLALALFLGAEAELLLSGSTPVSILSAAVFTLPIAIRRRLPIVAVAGLVAAPLLGRALDGMWETTPVAFPIALLIVEYSVAAYGSAATAVLGGLLAFGGSALSEEWSAVGGSELGVVAALAAGPWLAGWFAGPLRRETEELSALAAELERQRDANTRLAVAEERARLARELHDAVAHSVSAMVIQGAAAEAVLSGSPADARRSLRAVQTLGRASVTELRRMLQILRTAAEGGAPGAGWRPSPRMRRYRRLRWSQRLDALLAMACFVVAEWVALTQFVWDRSRLTAVALMAVATLPLAVRRRFPLAVMLTSTVAVALHQHLLDPVRMPASAAIPILIGLYTVGAHATPRRAVAGAAVAVLIAAVVDAALWDEGVGWFLFAYSLIGGSFVVSGYAVRLNRRNAEQMHTLAERLRREGDALARLAVVDERTRVARELHDTIAHGVSVMVLQAGAAEQVMTSAPEQARHAARAVQDSGRSVLEELGRLLGLLQTTEAGSPRAPRPSLEHLDALVNRVRQAGLPVTLRVDGEPTRLTSGVDASVYRVIQEALTNALKHAGQVPTAVTVCYEPTSIALEVLSEGDRSGGRPARESGHGLVGMRERIEFYGGELHAGPEPSGGFAVRAHLPLEGGG
jgi:signal transduction histidine kinase